MYVFQNQNGNGSANPIITIPNSGYQFYAWGIWDGATVTLNLKYDNNSTLIPLGVLNADGVINTGALIVNAILVAIISNSSVLTNLNLAGGVVGVYA
jgi:hypothetical protein